MNRKTLIDQNIEASHWPYGSSGKIYWRGLILAACLSFRLYDSAFHLVDHAKTSGEICICNNQLKITHTGDHDQQTSEN